METPTNLNKPHNTIDSSPAHWWQRVGWLILIWSLSVLSLGVVAYGIRKFMNAAGMTT
jgi:hypothetical protein